MTPSDEMTAEKYPYVRAAHINALAEEGTRAELIEWMQKQWNEICWLRHNARREENEACAAVIQKMIDVFDGDKCSASVSLEQAAAAIRARVK